MDASLATPSGPRPGLVRWHYLWYVAGALAVLVAAVLAGNLWLLDWVHVVCGVLGHGVDRLMGCVIGAIMRRVSIPVRGEVIVRPAAVTLFLMPALSMLASTAGWFLALRMGYVQLPWPQFGWIAAALVLVT